MFIPPSFKIKLFHAYFQFISKSFYIRRLRYTEYNYLYFSIQLKPYICSVYVCKYTYYTCFMYVHRCTYMQCKLLRVTVQCSDSIQNVTIE